MSVEIKRFDMRNIDDDKVCVMIGKRNTGKSFLVKDLLYYHKDIPIGNVLSGTEEANGFYGKMMPQLFIHGGYTPDIVDRFIKRQRQVIKELNKERERGVTAENSSIDPRAFFILDDCLYDNSWTTDINIRSLFMNGRHYKVFFIITMQYPLGIPPNLRANIDYVFILRNNNTSDRKRIYEHYAGVFPSFDIFCQVMDQCTQNYECLVINNTVSSTKLEDCVFWYKADPHDDFKIGHPTVWKYNNQHCKSADEDDDEDFDVNKLKKKKSSTYLTVKKTY
jgi:hypothetical protein